MVEQVPGYKLLINICQILAALDHFYLPFAVELNDRMMGCPSLDRLQYPPLVSERTERRVSDSIDKVVSISGRVREVVPSLILMDPSSFEESAIVLAGMDRPPISIVDGQLMNVTIE